MAGNLFKRNLAKCGKYVTLETRDERIINGRSQEVFTTFGVDPVRTIIKTVHGVSVFDSTNTERVATHKLCLEYQAGVTAEMWVKFGSKRIKILTVENCCEEDEVLILMCTERGDDSKVVNEG